MKKCVLFVGPSLSHSEASRLIGKECDIRPPVRRGDLPALPSDVKLIAIVDGVFLGEAAVGHREILDKLRAGIIVVGGGSMGALRASELRIFGMKGIGEVFRLYSEGVIEGDDEVALIFNPEDLGALSEPLVNMRHNLERASTRRIIGEKEKEEIMKRLKGVHYPKRTKEAMLEIASELLPPSTLSRFEILLMEDYIDIKREDALEVIRFMKTQCKKGL